MAWYRCGGGGKGKIEDTGVTCSANPNATGTFTIETGKNNYLLLSSEVRTGVLQIWINDVLLDTSAYYNVPLFANGGFVALGELNNGDVVKIKSSGGSGFASYLWTYENVEAPFIL